METPEGVLGFVREAGDDRRMVLANFTGEPLRTDAEGDWVVELASDGSAEGRVFDGCLGPDAALLLRPT